jgi:hypothetical protein
MDKERDLKNFAVLLTRAAAAFDVSLNMTKIEAYWEILAPYRLEEIAEAILRYARNPDEGRYFPRPAEIIAAIHGNSRDQAFKAWTKVMTGISRVGGYSSIAFDDPLIHAVIEDMGGWQRLCVVEEKQLPFVAKEFQERYRGYVFSPPTRYPPYLPGRIESTNSAYGYGYEPPIMIGDAAKVVLVINGGSDQMLLITYPKNNFLKKLSQSIPTE